MAKHPIISAFLCFSTLILNSNSLFLDNKKIIPPFRVYSIGIASGPNANIYDVARARISTTRTSFGIVDVTDTVISAGLDPNSQLLGRNQGTIVTTGLFEPAEVVNLNVIFTAGNYKGSSIAIAGQRLIGARDQEVPIAGGTGFFRGAGGYTLSSFISYNPTTDTYIFAYDFYVVIT